MMPYVYSRPYVYSFCQIFQALRLFRTLKSIENTIFRWHLLFQIPNAGSVNST